MKEYERSLFLVICTFWDSIPTTFNSTWLNSLDHGQVSFLGCSGVQLCFLDFPAPWISLIHLKNLSFPLSLYFFFASSNLSFSIFLWLDSFLLTSLMDEFSIARQSSPFVSFFFAKLGVFLEFSSGWCPQNGLFVSRNYALRPIFFWTSPYDTSVLVLVSSSKQNGWRVIVVLVDILFCSS